MESHRRNEKCTRLRTEERTQQTKYDRERNRNIAMGIRADTNTIDQ
jgi:hypothetical protein